MIKGECHTNVDEGRGKEWPTVFAKVPEKGELVESLSSRLTLKVCQVTHCIRIIPGRVIDCVGTHESIKEPYIKVELTWAR